jgi:hypothetical protein
MTDRLSRRRHRSQTFRPKEPWLPLRGRGECLQSKTKKAAWASKKQTVMEHSRNMNQTCYKIGYRIVHSAKQQATVESGMLHVFLTGPWVRQCDDEGTCPGYCSGPLLLQAAPAEIDGECVLGILRHVSDLVMSCRCPTMQNNKRSLNLKCYISFSLARGCSNVTMKGLTLGTAQVLCCCKPQKEAFGIEGDRVPGIS